MAKDYDQWYIDIVKQAETPERGIITVSKLIENVKVGKMPLLMVRISVGFINWSKS